MYDYYGLKTVCSTIIIIFIYEYIVNLKSKIAVNNFLKKNFLNIFIIVFFASISVCLYLDKKIMFMDIFNIFLTGVILYLALRPFSRDKLEIEYANKSLGGNISFIERQQYFYISCKNISNEKLFIEKIIILSDSEKLVTTLTDSDVGYSSNSVSLEPSKKIFWLIKWKDMIEAPTVIQVKDSEKRIYSALVSDFSQSEIVLDPNNEYYAGIKGRKKQKLKEQENKSINMRINSLKS